MSASSLSVTLYLDSEKQYDSFKFFCMLIALDFVIEEEFIKASVIKGTYMGEDTDKLKAIPGVITAISKPKDSEDAVVPKAVAPPKQKQRNARAWDN